MKLLIFAIFAIYPFQIKAGEVTPYVGVNIGSVHVNATAEFNQNNFGLFIGGYFGGDGKARYEGEIGFYNNSYYENTNYLLAGVEWPVLKFEEFTVYSGIFTGVFEYPHMVAIADEIGIPRIGNYIMVPGVSGIAKFANFDIVVRATYGGGYVTDAIIGLQIRFAM